MRTIGLDIGTTTICASVVDGADGTVLESRTVPNASFLTGLAPWQKQQDPRRIEKTARELTEDMLRRFAPVGGIGVTGQMHGIVYFDDAGRAVSPLYTWQDGSGDQPCGDGRTYVQVMGEASGYPLATGFGAVTHYVHRQRGEVPAGVCGFCTIHDYIAMRLAGQKRPAVHPSDAASLGLFSLEQNAFDRAAVAALDMEEGLFPEAAQEYTCLGRTPQGVPVFTAIGDNQASFIGAVRDMDTAVLVNVGTGSQISLLSDRLVYDPLLETRPCVEGQFLLVGSSLCGGRAYALLEGFFRQMMQEAGVACGSLYPVLDRLSADFETLPDKLHFSTRFSGTRRHPEQRASITNLGIGNFTPRHFAVGVLEGTAEELYAFYAGMTARPGFRPETVVGSGNGIRRGEVLRRMLAARFGAPVRVPAHTEEAAYGAALYALVGAGAFPDIRQAQRCIRYQ